MNLLRCPVRGCASALRREPSRFACEAGHGFDLARAGYVNLVQPDEKRSPSPGDSAAVVQARSRASAAGLHDALIAVLERVARAACEGRGESPALLDVGCGDGTLLRLLANALPEARLFGLDLSTAAARLAARAVPRALIVVSNADHQLPFLDASLDVVLSVNARLPVAEMRRVLVPGGRLIVAVPGEDDLRELRARVQGASSSPDRVARVRAETSELFDEVAIEEARQVRRFEAGALRDALSATYRGGRRSQAERLEQLEAMELTSHHAVLTLSTRA